MTTETCSNCRFFQRIVNADGKCKAHPPVRVAPGQSAWPPTSAEEWCGEWRAVTGADAARAETSNESEPKTVSVPVGGSRLAKERAKAGKTPEPAPALTPDPQPVPLPEGVQPPAEPAAEVS